MDFELTDEQHALRDVIRDLVERDCPPALVRAVVEGRDDGSSFWKSLVEHDWTGIAIAAEDGGSGASAVELSLVLEALGGGADPSPFLATTSQYVPLIQACAVGDQRRALLQAVCAGSSGTVAFSAPTVSAAPDGADWVLSGVAANVVDGDRADHLAVVAAVDDGLGVFVVPAAAVTATRSPSFDRSLHLAEVRFDGARVPGDRAWLGDGIEGSVKQAGQMAVTGLSAMMVGASQRAFELVLDHLKHRHQFGVPIGSFQAVKHMAVDVYAQIERARAVYQFAALTIAEDDERRDLAPSMAKAAAGDCQRIAFHHGIQLFGGLGFTWENDLQLYLKRAKVGELLFGSSREHRARVGKAAMAASLATARAGREEGR